jgi:DedD protein
LDEQLKRRLTGAIVLVLLAVLFIPSILDGPGGGTTTTEIELPLPSQSGSDVEQRRFTLPTDAGSADPQQVADGDPSDGVTVDQPIGRDTTSEPVVDTAGTTHDAVIEAWAVQVGSFASRDNADRLVSQLVASGFSAFITQIEEGGRPLYRVRVGPEQDRRRAEVLAERLAGEVDVAPKVVEHP